MEIFDGEAFEARLRKGHRKRRIILGIIILVFSILALVTYFLYENSKVVEEILIFGNITRPQVTYNEDYVPFIAIEFSASITMLFLLIFDCIYCGVRSFQRYGQQVTLERRPLSNRIYVDGKEVIRIGPTNIHQVATIWFNNKVTATVCFSHVVWYFAYVTFSDHSTSIEI